MERNLPPTPMRLERARRDGNVPRSRHLATASVLLVGWGALTLQIPVVVANIGQLAQLSFATAASKPTAQAAGALLWRGIGEIGWSLLPALGVLWIATAVVGLVQVGPTWTWRPLRPDADRLLPSHYLDRLRQSNHPAELILQTVRVAALSGLSLHYLIAVAPRLLAVTPDTLSASLLTALDLAFGFGWRLALAMFLLGLIDYAWQRTRWLRALSMTRQELDDERRQTEGDPLLRLERRRVQRDAREQGSVESLAAATVVIVDGEGRLIALRWRPGEDEAPVVLGRAEGALAAAMADEARRLQRPTALRPSLLSSLMPLRLGEPVPRALYDEVARLLHELNAAPPAPPPRR